MKKTNESGQSDCRFLIQTSIWDAMNNLQVLSQIQKIKNERLFSEVIEISSDSDSDSYSLIKTKVKRKLPFPLSDTDDSGHESDERQKGSTEVFSGPTESISGSTKSLSVSTESFSLTSSSSVPLGEFLDASKDKSLTKPNMCSTPLRNQSAVVGLSPSLDISNITVQNSNSSPLSDTNRSVNANSDCSSDTIILNATNSPKKINICSYIIIPGNQSSIMQRGEENVEKSNEMDVFENKKNYKKSIKSRTNSLGIDETPSKSKQKRKTCKTISRVYPSSKNNKKGSRKNSSNENFQIETKPISENSSKSSPKKITIPDWFRSTSKIDTKCSNNESFKENVSIEPKQITQGTNSSEKNQSKSSSNNEIVSEEENRLNRDKIKVIKSKQNSPVNKVIIKNGSFANNDNCLKRKEVSNDDETNTEALPSTSQSSKLCPRSPRKGSPRKFVKKEHKTINTSYLTALRELFVSIQTYRHFRNLLSEENYVLKLFTSDDMDQQYQFLCLKLLTWKNKWYNIFKFCERINLYLENQEVIKLYNCLVKNNVVDTDFSNEDLCDQLHLLDMSDIQKICYKYRLTKPSTKEERIQSLLKFSKSQRTLVSSKSSKELLLKDVKQKLGMCVRLKKEFQNSFYNIYLLATFTNSAFANITDYFSKILGLKIYLPSFTLQEHVIFYTRNEFLSFAEARKLNDDYENAFTRKNHLEALQIANEIFDKLVELENVSEDKSRYENVPHLKRYTAKSIYINTLSKAAEYLPIKFPESVKKWLEYMISHVKSHRIGNWYNQLTWLYMKYIDKPDYEHASKLIIKVLEEEKDNLSEIQIHHLEHRGKQIQRTKKYKVDQLFHDTIAQVLPETFGDFPSTTVDAKTLRSNKSGSKRNYVMDDEDGNKTYMSVENIALQYYIKRCGYTDGRHCEGALIHALFALCFWDIIYDPGPPVPGTFLSKLQQVPLDMKTVYFYQNRKSLIDKRLTEIATSWTRGDLLIFLKDMYEKHCYEEGICTVNSVIADTEVDTLLETLVDCIERKTLSKIFQRLVKNYGAYRSGMPDLLIWNVDQKTAKFVEVKGEGDRLQTNQQLWLSYLRTIGANIEVCHVHSIGSKRKKIKMNETKIDG